MISWIKNFITQSNSLSPAQILTYATKSKAQNFDGNSSSTLFSGNANTLNLRTVKLIMVTANNNNKYYEMKENGDGTFTALYGRVGNQGTSLTYPIREWDKKHREKVRKGYIDQTYLFTENRKELEFEDLNDQHVQALINDLSRFAKQSISRNYNVSAIQVTRKQVAEAQEVLDGLVAKLNRPLNVSNFNKGLIDLYQIIPRKMTKVKDHLIVAPKTEEDFQDIEKKLAEEQATLDVMRAQVETLEKQENGTTRKMTLTQALGIKVEHVQKKELINQIKKMMGNQKHKFYRAYKVTNFQSLPNYEQHLNTAANKKVELFWHGSRNENWLSILKGGLVLRPANAIINGKMFGYGLYFADKFKKSLNYSSLTGSFWTGGSQKRGFLALYEVHVGRQLKIQKHQKWCYDLTEENLRKRGNYDSLYAKGGADLRNNEYIVYNESQCTVRYLIEVR